MMTKDQNSCILLFVKYPQKGTVKLRLARDLDEDIVLELYRCFVQDTLTTIKKIDVPFFICFHPPDAQSNMQNWLGSTLRFLPQQGNDLGERMKNSLTEVFAQGFQKAILLGSDSPDIPEESIKQAFTTLQTKDVVLGPTIDGGYYLIGFQTSTFTPDVFKGIHWSSPSVFQETLVKLQQAHRSVGLVPVWSDIDTLSVLTCLILRARNTSFKSSNTMTYIHHHPIKTEGDYEKKSGFRSN
jgi:hypothetical protein